jgi:hypothetical protein
MIATQILLLAMTSLAAKQNAVSLVGLSGPPAWIWPAAAAYLGVIAVRVEIAWRHLSEERKQKARLVLPENPADMRYWIAISFLAGISEEYAYRGVAYVALSEVIGSPILAVVICVLSFGIAHMFQGWRGVLGAMLLALLFHFMVFETQTLCLAITFHVAYDLVVGILGMRGLMRDGTMKDAQAQAAV